MIRLNRAVTKFLREDFTCCLNCTFIIFVSALAFTKIYLLNASAFAKRKSSTLSRTASIETCLSSFQIYHWNQVYAILQCNSISTPYSSRFRPLNPVLQKNARAQLMPEAKLRSCPALYSIALSEVYPQPCVSAFLLSSLNVMLVFLYHFLSRNADSLSFAFLTSQLWTTKAPQFCGRDDLKR